MLLLFLLFLVAATSSPASGEGEAEPVVNDFSHVCNSTDGPPQLYLPNSTFAANLAAMSATLPRNASATGFSAGAFGRAPDTAYGLGLCRGDIPGDRCAACLAMAFNGAPDLCRDSKDVIIFYDQCHVRFYDRDFLAGVRNAPKKVAHNMNNVSAWNVAEFDGLVTRLANAVADKASNASTKYATGQAGFAPEKINLFGLAQCTPDLTAAQCRSCLAGIIGEIPKSLSGRLGGRILGVRCNYRYEKDTFFHTTTDDMVTLAPLLSSSTGSKKTLWIVAIAVPVTVLLCGFLACFLWIRTRRRRVISLSGRVGIPTMSMEMEQVLKLWKIEESDSEFSLYDFDQIADATGNFSDDCKLGQGGFGAVYMGELSGGIEVAIKRLSTGSVQGLMEFKTEIQLIAKLQHTNLVRLLGCCLQAEEKMLIYEYMHNKSLDCFIFDSTRGAILNWERRFTIIDGIAQGLLYMHKHSRLRVVHRDLKASNILLDRDMNPKISDFGLARIFCSNTTEANTTRVMGTHGYIAPEYASEGLFSIKSDVYSFGVLLLEIISGKRTPGFYQHGKFCNLTGYAYRLWKEGKWHEMVDQVIGTGYPVTEVMKCVQVALLCVQDSAEDRPNMSDVVAMLGSEGLTLPEPRQPAYFNVRMSSFPESTGSFTESPYSYISNVVLTDGR
ncbi:hypothetical protein QYE76_040827 [Lolium multiflorum]|uniref:non-specific serine/threonine protein kinase n=1 Tax=Lolium multiflorum TaxID=4521 RepID=A0AAD8TDR7_LOLMU|nr:hypothetical protein QYE76_040827 [Lolium multiflorum]